MGGGDEVVAGHRLQHLAEVDHERAGHGRHVDPLAGGVLGLQAADTVLQQHGEEARVVVRVHTCFTERCGWVADQLGEAERPLAEQRAERVLGQAQPHGHDAHQLVGERAHQREELIDQLVESGQHLLRQPLVRAVEAKVGGLDVGRVRRVLARHIELFAVVDAVVGEFGADAFPAAEVARPTFVDLLLGRLGQGEERLESSEVAVDERGVDAVIDQREEAHLVADAAQFGSERGAVGAQSAPLVERHRGDAREVLAARRQGSVEAHADRV
jgi:hypothetical protein